MPLKKRRSKRKGEVTCTCSAYKFPHRFGGGKCNGRQMAETSYPCKDCISCVEYEPSEYPCAVVDGREGAWACDIVKEFISNEEVAIPIKWRKFI